jgi:hypothetical protein
MSSSLLEKEVRGFRIFPKAVTSITARKHADLVPDILRSTGLVKAVKYCTRNNLDTEMYTRDLIVLEKVWFPFMSAILALVPLEIEFVLHQNNAQNMRFMPVSSSWKDESPTGPLKALFVQPTTERVKLNEGDVIVYWSTMVYRIVTPQALHLLVPVVSASSTDTENLRKVAHVPVPANWSSSIGQKICTAIGYVRKVSSRYVAEQALTEKQGSQFVQAVRFQAFSPEYVQPRLTPEERKETQSVFLNRYDWVDADSAQKSYFSLQDQQLTQYEYAFLTRPYRFFALCLLGWLLVLLGVLSWLYKRLFGARAPAASVARRSRSASPRKPRNPQASKKTVPAPVKRRSKPRRQPSPKPVFVPVPVPVNMLPTTTTTKASPKRRRRKSPTKPQVVIQIRK